LIVSKKTCGGKSQGIITWLKANQSRCGGTAVQAPLPDLGDLFSKDHRHALYMSHTAALPGLE